MAAKKNETKDVEKKIRDLKIEVLKQPQKKRSIKKELARVLTMRNQTKSEEGQ